MNTSIEIKIAYDTVSFNFDLECNISGLLKKNSQTIKEVENKRITTWIEHFVNRVEETTNGEPVCLKIIGCDEYEKNYITDTLSNRESLFLDFELADNIKVAKVLRKIDRFFQEGINIDNPIVEDAVKEHRNEIKKLKSIEVEIPVVATMSSGKSTLLNAIIGQNLLPALNQATTATTCRIKTNNALKHFKGKVIDSESKAIIEEQENITEEFIKKHNERANEENIEIIIEGAVTDFDTQNFEVSFIDTPGPNNSQNDRHKESTFTYLKDNLHLPITLYVLNATQLGINDDKSVLQEIAKVFEDSKDSLERIIFVANKIDAFDIDKEPIADCLKKIRKYLADIGIKNAKIFPVSAEYARLAQTENKNRIERSNFTAFRSSIAPDESENHKGYELVEHSPLTPKQKAFLKDKIKKSEKDADLVYSGLASVKLYIEDYIKNHHNVIKYNKLYHKMNSILETIEANIEKEKSDWETKTEEEVALKLKEKSEVEKELEIKKNLLKEKIENIPVDRSFLEKEEKRIKSRENDLRNEISQKTQLTPNEALDLKNKIKNLIKHTEMSLRTTLESNLNQIIHSHLENLIKETRETLRSNVNSIEVAYFNAEMFNDISAFSENLDNLDQYKYKETVKKTWFERLLDWDWNWDRKMVNFGLFYSEKVQPTFRELQDVVSRFKEQFDNRIKSLNDSFIRKIEADFKDKLKKAYEAYQTNLKISEKERNDALKKLSKLKNRMSEFKTTTI